MEVKYEVYDTILGSHLPDDKSIGFLKEVYAIDTAWDLVQLLDRIILLEDSLDLYDQFKFKQAKRKAVRYYNDKEKYTK